MHHGPRFPRFLFGLAAIGAVVYFCKSRHYAHCCHHRHPHSCPHCGQPYWSKNAQIQFDPNAPGPSAPSANDKTPDLTTV